MLEIVKKSWSKNNGKLDDALREAVTKKRGELQYLDLFKIQIDTVVNPELDVFEKLVTDDAVYYANGYQGSEILIISQATISYLPDIFITYVDYGSCSGCDTLQALYSDYGKKNMIELVKGLKTLCLHMFQRMKQAVELFNVDLEDYSCV